MIKFLNGLKLTSEARDGISNLIFGDLTPDEAVSFNKFLNKKSEEEIMIIILNNLMRDRSKI